MCATSSYHSSAENSSLREKQSKMWFGERSTSGVLETFGEAHNDATRSSSEAFCVKKRKHRRRSAQSPAALRNIIPIQEPMKPGSSFLANQGDDTAKHCLSDSSFVAVASQLSCEEKSCLNNQFEDRETGTRRYITFSDSVEVVPIPMRKDYSHKARLRMWVPKEERQWNRERNKIEWEYEGRDLRYVIEDGDMVLDPVTGEALHPTWFDFEW